MSKKAVLAVVLALATVTGSASFAQESNKKNENPNIRSVEGTVTDGAGNPVANAIVKITDTRSLQVRSYITKEDGKYHFYGLSPNVDYTLKADHNGDESDSKRLSSFDTRKLATLQLPLKAKK